MSIWKFIKSRTFQKVILLSIILGLRCSSSWIWMTVFYWTRLSVIEWTLPFYQRAICSCSIHPDACYIWASCQNLPDVCFVCWSLSCQTFKLRLLIFLFWLSIVVARMKHFYFVGVVAIHTYITSNTIFKVNYVNKDWFYASSWLLSFDIIIL